MAQVEEGKQATILGLTERLTAQVVKLRDTLDDRFDRKPQTCSTDEGRPTMSNVLDEIIENLNGVCRRVDDIGDFLMHDILPKIN